MRVSLVNIKKRPDSDDVSRRETLLDGAALRVGRGAEMDVHLPDVNINYHHATLTSSGGVLVLEAAGDSEILIDGAEQKHVPLRPGVVALIGPYELFAETAPEGADFAIGVRLAEKTDDAPVIRAPETLAQTMPSKRKLAWLAFLLVIGVFLGWPMFEILQRPTPPPPGTVSVEGMGIERIRPVSSPVEIAWTSGPLSRAHAGLEDDCSACHVRPFEMTTNESCQTCHADVALHADLEKHPVIELEEYRCAACHKEHVGGDAPIERAAVFCTDCHQDLKALAPDTELANVTDFGANHPNFRPLTIVSAAFDDAGDLVTESVRAPYDAAYPLIEQSGLRFPHNKHLNAKGVKGPDKDYNLGCVDCHKPEADGALMRPVEMERDCGYCHQLTFNVLGVARRLPHAMPGEVVEIISDYYRARALEGGVEEATAPPGARRVPGAAMTPQERADTIAWASGEAEREIDAAFDKRLCGTCHEAEKNEETGGWAVYPAALQRHWMPKSQFDHEPHFAMDCVSCHAATTSGDAKEILMPQIGLCQDCHKGEASGVKSSASSECIACHGFHYEELGPMSPKHADLFRERSAAAERAELTTAVEGAVSQ